MKYELSEVSFPLSPLQQGMLYHNLTGDCTGVDIEQVLGTLRETIDVAAFEYAWQQVVSRHEILRTGFHWKGAVEPVQEVRGAAKLPFHVEDWSDLTVDEREKAFATWLEADRLQGFDIAHPPLARVAMFRVADAEWKMVWTVHHLLLDARGMVLVLKEVFGLYEAALRGEELPLPSLKSYREHVDCVLKQDGAAAEKFWRETLKGFTAATPLVVAHANTNGIHSEAGSEHSTSLDETTTRVLNSIATQNGLTLNTLVQGAWALLWHRYSGESDIVFGAVRAGRRSTVEDADSIVGLFINTIPVRTRYTPDAQLLPWLTELRQQWVGLRPYEHTALADVQGWSDVPRDQPLFETLFNFHPQKWDAPLRQEGGPWLQREFALRSRPSYPLTLDACGGDALELKLIYDRRRFEDTTVLRMLGHLRTLLEAIAHNPNRTLGQLPMLTASEREQLLVEWNRTDADFPSDKSVHELFSEQAKRTPDALAIADQNTQLSYRELDERSTHLALALQARGIGADACVAACFERSVEMIVAWLGVLKSGAAYLPLDPHTPEERIAFMVKEVTAPVLLIGPGLTRPEIPEGQTLTLSEATGNSQSVTSSQHATRNTSDLAYIIFTSGSTGTPKAVAIEHRSLTNLVVWHQRTYQVTAEDRATQVANPAFDASGWEVWPYLTAGASIHIADDETIRWPSKLVAWLVEQKISLTFLPTPLAEATFAEDWPAGCQLRAVLTGGDALHTRPPETFPCPLVNHYGPTENTVVATSVPMDLIGTSTPPIGRPINNTQVYVLDGQLQPVPIGVPGELHIGGDGLARGYVNQPALTAEKFISNPFAPNSSARLYKTGDLVRWRADGQLEFLGRMDCQIKVRGHRIEPGEIEAFLMSHPAVVEAAVIGGKAGLTAFIVQRSPTQAQSLREFLKMHLPDYMVPVSFDFVEALPRTPNGKVDRKALAARALSEPEEAFVAPRNETETTVAGIWSEVLAVNRIGIHDNFFHIGGHSLLASRVVSRVRDVFGRDVPLKSLFDAPTLSAFAEKISSARIENASLILRRARNGMVPLSFAQERLWFLEQLEPGIPFNNIPFAFCLQGALNAEALEAALNEIVRRHEPLQTSVRNQHGLPVAARDLKASLTLAQEDLSDLPASEREERAQQCVANEARTPFDLSKSPLLRAKLLRLDEHTHWLVLVTHHIACDGWSMEIFHHELANLYEAFAAGRQPALPELEISYADFADWQRELLQGGSDERDLVWWKNQLEGLVSLALPTDRPRAAIQTFRGGTVPVAVPAALTRQLLELARCEGVTPFMLLLAAFQMLLQRYSGQDDIVIGTPVAGRERVETEKLIGLFLNTIVLRNSLAGDLTFIDLLRKTRQAALDAFAHQRLPFEKVAEALQNGRDLSRPPVFQVMFVLQNEPAEPLKLSGLEVIPIPTHSGTSKFDLTLSLEESTHGLSGYFEFNADLFDASTIARMGENFAALLGNIVAAPAAKLSELAALSTAERNRLLVEWNKIETEFPAEKCIHELFAEQVARTPNAIAVTCGDESLTYDELNSRAEQVAAELRALGIGPEKRVGICAERSLEMMVGLLGILKAGGCYVPLDPKYPKERLAYMLEDSQAAVLVTQRDLTTILDFKLPTLLLDAERGAPDQTSAPTVRGTSANLAYVIYTSGSTGRPKGVMVSHRNVVNFFTAMDAVLGRSPSVWLAVTSISFDISVLELFWTLSCGFQVVIHRDAVRNQPQPSIAELIAKHKVTHFQCTPSLASGLMLAPEAVEALMSLKVMLLGGEALPGALAQKLRRTLRGELLNMYGPTETTVWSAVHRVTEAEATIPIGQPIANTQLFILDANQQPAPIGVPGELFIGGEGVTRGYHKQPELTAERFIRNPFSQDPNARLYRTGDLARYRADGNVEFLGRLDHQVKLRGHRIELGEIESVLRRHPDVRECVVDLREIAPGDQRLIGYVVATRSDFPARDLRKLVEGALPDYMVPADFVLLGKLPLTPNGKVDRKALPALKKISTPATSAFVPPRTALEKQITALWQELLHAEKIGLNDNFFDLGGHSLLVVQMQAKLRETFDVNLPVVRLFQHPTVSALARCLGDASKKTSLKNIRDRGRRQREAFVEQPDCLVAS